MKIKKYKYDILIIFSLYFVVYACMYVMHYGTDTIYAITNSDIYGKGNIALGRYGCEAVYCLARLFHINYVKSFVFLITIMILSFTFFSTIVSIHIQELLDVEVGFSKWIIIIASVMVFANVFVQEWFVFWECSFQWSFSAIFLGIAIMQIKKSVNVKQVILACAFLTLGLGFYQAILPIFLILGCTIIYIKNDGILNRKSFFETVLIVFIGGMASIINLLSIKFFQIIGMTYATSRTEPVGISTIISNVRIFIRILPDLIISTFGLYPKYLFAMLSVILIIGSIFNIVQGKTKVVNKICYMILLIIFSSFTIFIPHLFTSSIWLAQRTLVGFWTIGSMLILVCWRTSKENKSISMLCITVAVIALFVNFEMIQDIEMNIVTSNLIEQQNAMIIQDKIEEYESESGIEIKYIAVMNDGKVTYRNPVAKYRYCDTNRALLTTSWSDVAAINFFNKKNYIKIEMPEEIYNEYVNKDWNYFNPNEQLIFNLDTLYWIIY